MGLDFLQGWRRAEVSHLRQVIILQIISLSKAFHFPRGEKEFLLTGQDGESYGVADVEVD